MQWVPCTSAIDLLGQREGHCAVVLRATPSENHDSDAKGSPPAADSDAYIVVFGGYCEGELTGEPIISPVTALPALNWTALPHEPSLERDGASLTALGDDGAAALLFGGLDADFERTNALCRLRLCGAAGAAAGRPPALVVEPCAVTGDVPAPRSRHGAGYADGRLYVFGGETDAAEQVSDLYVLEVAGGVWRRVVAGPPAPPARLLSLSLVFVAPSVMVLYGGCHFVGGNVASLDDSWAFYAAEERWAQIGGTSPAAAGEGTPSTPAAEGGRFVGEVIAPDVLPRCNGHRGCCVADAALFVGGKDGSTGDNRVKVVRYDAATGAFTVHLRGVHDHDLYGSGRGRACGKWQRQPIADDNDDDDEEEEDEEEEIERNSRLRHPHWRYTPALVPLPGSQNLLLLGGQCRHPQHTAAYILTVSRV